jgi:uncharacterized cofD-like protein
VLCAEAEEAILAADLIVIAPGNFYRSLLPTLAVTGMRETLEESEAKKVMVSNLMTTPGQTDGWHVVDYVKGMERYIGIGRIDTVLFNNQQPSRELLENYATENEYPVDTSRDKFSDIAAQHIGAPLVAKEVFVPQKNDTLIRRTLIRHDAREVRKQLARMLVPDAQ